MSSITSMCGDSMRQQQQQQQTAAAAAVAAEQSPEPATTVSWARWGLTARLLAAERALMCRYKLLHFSHVAESDPCDADICRRAQMTALRDSYDALPRWECACVEVRAHLKGSRGMGLLGGCADAAVVIHSSLQHPFQSI